MLTKEQKDLALAIALKTEVEGYDDRILEMIFYTLGTKSESEATAIYDFWVTYRPWTAQLAIALCNYEERTRKKLEETLDFISYTIK